MKLPIRCYSCNRNISKYEYIYAHYLQKEVLKMKENKSLDQDVIYGTTSIHINMEKVFDLISIPPQNYCCRKHLVSAYPFWDAYVGYNIDNVQPETPYFLQSESKSKKDKPKK